MTEMIDYTLATQEYSAYSDDFRMKKFAEANCHVSNNKLIQQIEQELADFQSEHNAIVAETHLIASQQYLNLLQHRTNQRIKFKDAVNKNKK